MTIIMGRQFIIFIFLNRKYIVYIVLFEGSNILKKKQFNIVLKGLLEGEIVTVVYVGMLEVETVLQHVSDWLIWADGNMIVWLVPHLVGGKTCTLQVPGRE